MVTYYLIIVDSFSKWPDILKCRHSTSTNTVNVLNELFRRFGVTKTLVSDNGTQFTDREFKNFSTSLFIDHITTSVYHPKYNGQTERFVNTFKRALRKNQGMDTDERSIQKFFAVYRITPNPNTDSGLSPAEQMFARKIRSIFDRLLLSPTKKVAKKYLRQNFTNQETEFSSEITEVKKSFWEDGIITKRLDLISKEDLNVRDT